MIVGEDEETKGLKKRQETVDKAKVELVQRELIVEVCAQKSNSRYPLIPNQSIKCYRFLGNSRADVSDNDENIVGRNYFYTGFLL